MAKSQAELENQLQQRWAQVQSQALTPQQAFSRIEEWVIQVGERHAFLVPDLKQWMWYDRRHKYWVFAGCSVNQAILLSFGGLAGIKKLPQPGNVGEWCVYQQAQSLLGPVPVAHLRYWIQNRQVPPDIVVWSPRAANWLTADQFMTLPA